VGAAGHRAQLLQPQAIVYRSVYLDRSLCAELPAQPCSLVVSDILKAILGDFARRDLKVARDGCDQRLVQVLLDQLHQAPRQTCYLPFAHSDSLGQVLAGLQAEPGDNRPLADWAAQVHVSERTLARQFLRELGMSFGEWRLRLRFLRAIEALEAGRRSRPSPSTWATAAARRSSPCSSARPAARRSSTGGRPGQRCKNSCLHSARHARIGRADKETTP
jgi:AraC-like DNA-binding protein